MDREVTFKLNATMKFRKEKKYILLCDCKNLVDYELPLIYYELLMKIKMGLPQSAVKQEDKELINDLLSVKAIRVVKLGL